MADVVDQVDAAFGGLQQRVRIAKRLEPIMVDVDTAIPLGLITTELLTNAYRHAFPAGAAGIIRVELAVHAGIVELTVADNGVGPPKDERSSASTGLRLVQALAKQIGGTFAVNAGPGRKAPYASHSGNAHRRRPKDHRGCTRHLRWHSPVYGRLSHKRRL